MKADTFLMDVQLLASGSDNVVIIIAFIYV